MNCSIDLTGIYRRCDGSFKILSWTSIDLNDILLRSPGIYSDCDTDTSLDDYCLRHCGLLQD